MTRSICVLLCVASSLLCADDWPQWRGPQRDGVWREEGVLQTLPPERLPYEWSVDIGPGYSGPTVAEGRVYVTDRGLEGARGEEERVLCVDEKTGDPLWVHAYPVRYEIGYGAGPRASVTVADGHAFAVGAMGHFHCFDAATGEILWMHDLHEEYEIEMPMWGIAGAPLVYDDLVIQHTGGAKGACVVAFDIKTGRERWRSLDDRAGYSAPIVIQQADRDVVVCWTGDSVSGLAPDDGSVLWRFPFPPQQMPIGIGTPITDGQRLFVSSFYDGSLMLRLKQDTTDVELLWRKVGRDERNTEALHAMIGTPLIKGDYLYGVDSYGQLRCLDARTGERIWEDLTAVPQARWATIHIVQHGGREWMLNDQGELIIATLTPEGYTEHSRTKLLDQTTQQLPRRGGVTWAHPAFANRHIYARNDEQLICASVEAE